MKQLSLLIPFSTIICLVFSVSCVSKEVEVTETYYETEYRTEYKMETYTETEDVVVKTIEGKEYLSPIVRWQTGLYFPALGTGALMTYYYGYAVGVLMHSRNKVEITLTPGAVKQKGYILVCDLGGIGQIPPLPRRTDALPERRNGVVLPPGEQAWLDQINAVTANPERILGALYITGDGTQNRIVVDPVRTTIFAIFANTWVINPISSAQLVWSDDVIEKQTLTKERQVPYQVPVQVEKQRTVMQTKRVPFWEVILGK